MKPMSQSSKPVSSPVADLVFVGDLDCVRLCNNAMQEPLYDCDDESPIGDLINTADQAAWTADEVAAFDEWCAAHAQITAL
jgi:hypothetical protein